MNWHERTAKRDTLRRQPHLVYIARSNDGAVLYVGCTNDLARRLKAHRHQSEWPPFASTIETHEYPNWWAARAAEGEFITALSPAFNKVNSAHPDTPYGATVRRLALGVS